jgi:hypothetical protein
MMGVPGTTHHSVKAIEVEVTLRLLSTVLVESLALFDGALIGTVRIPIGTHGPVDHAAVAAVVVVAEEGLAEPAQLRWARALAADVHSHRVTTVIVLRQPAWARQISALSRDPKSVARCLSAVHTEPMPRFST